MHTLFRIISGNVLSYIQNSFQVLDTSQFIVFLDEYLMKSRLVNCHSTHYVESNNTFTLDLSKKSLKIP